MSFEEIFFGQNSLTVNFTLSEALDFHTYYLFSSAGNQTQILELENTPNLSCSAVFGVNLFFLSHGRACSLALEFPIELIRTRVPKFDFSQCTQT